MRIADFKTGSRYLHNDIVEAFQCGNMGGMRRSKKTNTLMLICDHTKGLYDDMWHGDVLHYTGMGKVGDQVLQGNQNKTLYESGKNGIHVHLFEVLSSADYTYRGEVKLVEKPYQDTQNDDNGDKRKVWMFPIKPIDTKKLVTPRKYSIPVASVQNDNEKERKLLEANATPEFAETLPDDVLQKAAELRGRKHAAERQVTTTQRDRDPFVSEHVKRRANGICDLCEMPAPFKDKKNRPYLECHHVKWLVDDGEDTIGNAVALCPNCHRKTHTLNEQSNINALMNALACYKRKGR